MDLFARKPWYAASAVTLLSIALLTKVATAAPPAAGPSLQQRLQGMAAVYPGQVGLYAHDFSTGATVSIHPDTPVPTASVIKVALLLETMHQIKDGKLSLDTPLVLTKHNQVPGSGILKLMTPGLQLTLHDALTLMMTLSDNTATNLVIDKVGLAPTNALMAKLGMNDTYFYSKVFMKPAGPVPADHARFGLGKTTPKQMGELIERIYHCDLGDGTLCRDMVTMMRNQQYRAMLPRYLDDADASDGLSPIADKVGEVNASRNDVALVYAKNGPMVISIFTHDNPDHSWTPQNHAEEFIGRLAQAIVNEWSPQGLATEIPHLLAPQPALAAAGGN